MCNKFIRKIGIIVFLPLYFICVTGFAQKSDSVKIKSLIKGGVTVTNNGISLIPTFSLGKPAAIFDLALGRKRLTFEPQLRWGLNGKPWSYIFWGRYKLIQSPKFKFNVGTHISNVFKSESFLVNNITTDVLSSRRYLAAEFVPNYYIRKNISVGLYYLFSHGLDPGTTLYTHFLTLNTNFSHITLSKNYFVTLAPQVYYLKMDDKKGYYFNSTIGLANRNYPILISSILNKAIHTEIIGKDFNWNVSLTYFFNNRKAK